MSSPRNACWREIMSTLVMCSCVPAFMREEFDDTTLRKWEWSVVPPDLNQTFAFPINSPHGRAPECDRGLAPRSRHPQLRNPFRDDHSNLWAG
jgi:hypothetical protein